MDASWESLEDARFIALGGIFGQKMDPFAMRSNGFKKNQDVRYVSFFNFIFFPLRKFRT